MAAAVMQNKRKREPHDMAGGRAAPGMHSVGEEFDQHYIHTDQSSLANTDPNMDFAAVLGHHNTDPSEAKEAPHPYEHAPQPNNQNGGQSVNDTAAAAMAQYHTMTVPQSTEQSFMAQEQAQAQGQSSDGVDTQATPGDPGDADTQQRNASFGAFDIQAAQQASPNGDASPTAATASGANAPKPAVGSDEWHKVRRDNHKEVERRRRETINEGINELAKIVPGCEKNKGSILARAVQFITQLKENETSNIEKWTLEKLLTEQAIAELSNSCDKLRDERQRAWEQCEGWKKAALKAGVTATDVTGGGGGGGDGDQENREDDG